MPSKLKKTIKRKPKPQASKPSAKKKAVKKAINSKKKPKIKKKAQKKKTVKKRVKKKKTAKPTKDRPLNFPKKEVIPEPRHIDSTQLVNELKSMQAERPRQQKTRHNGKTTSRLDTLPESLKYSLIFFVASAMIIILFIGVFSVAMAWKPQEIIEEAENNTDGEFADIVAQAVEENLTIETTTSTTITTTSSTTSTSMTYEPIVCDPPYMRFGMGCCLDTNGNSICDDDETPAETTTTLTDIIRCATDIDCGRTRVELECRDNEAHRVTIAFTCKNAGTKSSTCELSSLDDVIDVCEASEQCYIRGDEIICKRRSTPNNLNR